MYSQKIEILFQDKEKIITVSISKQKHKQRKQKHKQTKA